MFPRTTLYAALAATLSMPSFAGSITVEDPYFRYSGAMARAGAAFMELVNAGDTDDRLIAASSDLAARIELHTHKEDGDGVMRMVEVEEGFQVPAGGSHVLQRGGDHVMFMGLQSRPEQGEMVTLTLVFEEAGEITIEVPVDLERQPRHGAMQHGKGQGHGQGMGKSN